MSVLTPLNDSQRLEFWQQDAGAARKLTGRFVKAFAHAPAPTAQPVPLPSRDAALSLTFTFPPQKKNLLKKEKKRKKAGTETRIMVHLICRILDEEHWLSHCAQPVPKQHTANSKSNCLLAPEGSRQQPRSLCDFRNAPNILSQQQLLHGQANLLEAIDPKEARLKGGATPH